MDRLAELRLWHVRKSEDVKGVNEMAIVVNPGLSKLMEEMDSIHLPGRVLFAKIAGSHSHNMAVPTSDIDISGVYLVGTKDVLGLDKVKDTIGGEDKTFHEAGKFASLLLKGNSTIFEMLYTDKMCYVSGPFNELMKKKKRFLSRKVIKQYLGYMQSQMRRLEKGQSMHTTGGEYNSKFAFHFLRLGMDGISLAQGKFPDIWKVGEDRQFLMNVRLGKYTQTQVLEFARGNIEAIESYKPWSLPDDGDKRLLNDWLVDLRMKGLEE